MFWLYPYGAPLYAPFFAATLAAVGVKKGADGFLAAGTRADALRLAALRRPLVEAARRAPSAPPLHPLHAGRARGKAARAASLTP